MQEIIKYLVLSGVLTALLWTPYILARVFLWGLPSFLNNYPSGFPKESPEPPMWAIRAHRAHLNMVETMPAFIAVVVAALFASSSNATVLDTAAKWSEIFFQARVAACCAPKLKLHGHSSVPSREQYFSNF